MENKQAIEQLKDLRDDFTSIVNFKEDVEALDIAIKALERTALEVPVQEQLSKYYTKDLVEELSKRDGVEVTIAEPYEDIEVKANGPAIVLKIID